MKKQLNKLKQVSVALFAVVVLSACTPHQAIDTLFKGSDNATAHRVVKCESNYNPNAVSRTNDHGLFQINAMWNKPGHHDPVADWIGRNWHKRYEPATNALMAKMIRDKYGWKMWACH
jgi:hypothetical protein